MCRNEGAPSVTSVFRLRRSPLTADVRSQNKFAVNLPLGTHRMHSVYKGSGDASDHTIFVLVFLYQEMTV